MSAYSAAGAVAEEVLNGIKTVFAFNAQYFEFDRYKKHLGMFLYFYLKLLNN